MIRALFIATGSVFVAAVLSISHGFNVSHSAAGSRRDSLLRVAYGRIPTGAAVSELAALGMNPINAEYLSFHELVERFQPKQTISFKGLNPAIKNCYLGSDCTAYVFDDYSDEVVLLIQGGRVTWKAIFAVIVANNVSPWMRRGTGAV